MITVEEHVPVSEMLVLQVEMAAADVRILRRSRIGRLLQLVRVMAGAAWRVLLCKVVCDVIDHRVVVDHDAKWHEGRFSWHCGRCRCVSGHGWV